MTADSLAGFWRIGTPTWGPYREGMTALYGPIMDNYCRIETAGGAAKVRCERYSDGLHETGEASLERDSLHITFGSLLAHAVIDARRQPAGGFTGGFAFKLMAMRFAAPGAVTAARLDPWNGPDPGGEADKLTAILNGIAEGAPQAVQLREGSERRRPEQWRRLGPVRRIAWLGRTPTTAEAYTSHPAQRKAGATAPRDDDAGNVYAVAYESVHRICVLRPRWASGDLNCF